MGLTKDELANKERREALAKLKEILEIYYPQVSCNSERDFLEDVGYEPCASCEDYFIGQSLIECNACSESFCNDCQEEHGREETGF